MKVIELFAGIGSQTQALKNLGIAHEVIGISEIDKYAIKSYEAIHGPVNNFGDITKIEKLPYCDLLTYSFPCQDISVAGKQAGIKEGTRSGLLFEVERLLENMEERPKYLLLENVKNLVGKGHKVDFDKWLNKLEEMGYRNYWKALNAKDYGIPQNRDRVFVVSIRNNIKKEYKFPEKQELKLKLKDMLESEVDEKYFLKGSYLEWWEKNKEKQLAKKYSSLDNDIAICQTTRQYASWNGNYIQCLGMLDIKGNEQVRRVYSDEGISPTLNTMQGGNRQPKIIVKEETKQGYAVAEAENFIEKKYKEFIDKKGYTPEMFNPYNCQEVKDIAPTQTTICGSSTSSSTVLKNENHRIRKLTPIECWRLMGFKDEQFCKAKLAGISDSQLYKQAGNSIVVNVLEAIFKKLF